MSQTMETTATARVENDPNQSSHSATTGRHSDCCRAVLWDGTELFYRHWPAATPSDQSVVLFHRGHEHSGRLLDLVDRLNLKNVHVFAWDARGHGQSPGERGHAPSYGTMIRDVDSFVRHLTDRHQLPVEQMIVVAHSVGAVTVAAWVHDYHPPVRGMMLVTPAFRVRLYVPLAIPGLRLMAGLRGNFNVKSYVRGGMLTHDSEMAQSYDTDPLVSRNISVRILLGLHDTATRLLNDAEAIEVPTLILSAESDWVVRNDAQKKFFDRLSSTDKTFRLYAGMKHALLHEADRDFPISDMREWIVRRLESPSSGPRQAFHSANRYERLLRPAPWWQRPRWWMVRGGLVLGGRLSSGIRIGWEDGFDSGRSLDYVYRNQPEGAGPIGRWVDRIYLNAPGWRGIRQRKINMHQTLDKALRECLAESGKAHVLDIASGPGRYLLDVLTSWPDANVRATMRDRDQAGLEAGRQLAAQKRLSDRVSYETGDAFDETRLASMTGSVDIAIVSGLYELFSRNELVETSLKGLSGAVRPGGVLIYTNQPWHPQLEMIARTLPNRDGQHWVMRCRSQAEMDGLVTRAGFAKTQTLADDEGIFTVSMARRI